MDTAGESNILFGEEAKKNKGNTNTTKMLACYDEARDKQCREEREKYR